MVAIAGYEDLIPIYEGTNSQVYRAQQVTDQKRVILKLLTQDYPTPGQIRRYKQEYTLTRQVDSPGIIKAYSLEKWQRSYLIVFEDFGGISLAKWLKHRTILDLQAFLSLAIAATESLGQIHDHNIIHKDINPTNLVFNATTEELKIIDFGIATQLSRECPTLQSPNILEGTLAYISPEQTGRMNRSVDYRTDFYSLGVTFYEMLTGQLPFDTEDPLELIHCHLAQYPPSPHQLYPEIPQVVSDLVMKLMAKTAEERYQSAWGIQTDLTMCLMQWEVNYLIEDIVLGEDDITEKFQIPQKLYGREAEITSLLAGFERVATTGQVEFMMVVGDSGIGKSYLVQELYKPITARRGYFISGKFEQFQRNVPYSGIISAFQGLIEQLLGESDSQLQRWRDKLLQALGGNGQVIIDIIPELELIIGQQPPLPQLGNNESQNRFNLVIRKFIDVFLEREHPLVLFLDDLQWADLATLTLLEKLLGEGKTQYLLLLGAYRINEVEPGHPLAITLEKIQQKNENFSQIHLKALSLEDITVLIQETLKSSFKTVQALGILVYKKTGGNPFFVNEFLQALYQEKLLKFHNKSRTWQWKIESIQIRKFSDNLVDLMVAKLKKIPLESQNLLTLAACLGGEFDLETLTWMEEKSSQEIYQSLKIILDENLIIPLSQPDENLLIQSYKFSHDRIQQAAYHLIPQPERSLKHLQLGQVFLDRIPPEEQGERLFEIINQLNRGLQFISDPQQRIQLVHLNLQAGRKAIQSNAYDAALSYLEVGLTLLDETPWQSQYELTLNLYQEAAKAAYLNGDLERMETWAKIIADEAKTPLDLLELGKIKIDAYSNQGRLNDALEAGLESLALLEIRLPQTGSLVDFEQGLTQVQTLLDDRSPGELLNLPKIQDPLMEEALVLLVKLAFIATPTLSTLLLIKQLELSIIYGNSPASAYSYATYGSLLCGIQGEFALGYEYGQLALQVLAQFNNRQFEAATLLTVHGFINPCKTHLTEALAPLQRAFLIGLETGELTYGGYANHGYCLSLYLTGRSLAEIQRDIEHQNAMLEGMSQQTSLIYNQIFLQTILNLQQSLEAPHRLVGKAINEDELIGYFYETQNGIGLWEIYIAKATLSYLFEEFDEALAASTLAQQYLDVAKSHYLRPIWYFYHALIWLMKISQTGIALEDILDSPPLKEVQENQIQLKFWAESAPMNYLHKFYLVEAEYQRVIGNKEQAIEYYHLAITEAKKNGYFQEEALANELTAKFYLAWKMDKVAQVYMVDAHYLYLCWGAIAKVKNLEQKYPQLCKSNQPKTIDSNPLSTQMTSESTDTTVLDLWTIIKSTSAISSEIVLDKLLTTLMDILIENAGAQRGILILAYSEGLCVEAIREVDSSETALMTSIPLYNFQKICLRLVYYVARTKKTIVLNHAMKEGNFTDDDYIQQNHCQSIACTPLINQGKLKGIIYLENNLTTGTFTKERLSLLRTLATQAAISLENAQLYNNITTLNKAYERFIPAQFLSFLEKETIVDVKLGDQVEREMTVLFSDIRDFTTISEQMTPAENFAFINEYLGYMEPQIQRYGGFIDKYIGDAIMALFPNSADDAIKGSLEILNQLQIYNQIRQDQNLQPLRIGIGLHTGSLMLGTVGGLDRMDGTAIGDAVNLSSRVEGLTKTYGVSLLITHHTFSHLSNPLQYDFRFIDKVKAKGKAKAVSLFEVFSKDPSSLKSAKIATKEKFEKAVLLYNYGEFLEAASLFQDCVDYHEGDRAARKYLERCHQAG